MIFVVANSNGELQWNRPMWRLRKRKRKQVIPVYILSKTKRFASQLLKPELMFILSIS